MMGKDCERILGQLNIIMNLVIGEITGASDAVMRPVKIDGYYDKTDSHVTTEYIEKEEVEMSTSNIRAALNSFAEDLSKMEYLESDMYTSSNTFNNCCGSPWVELKRLKMILENVVLLDTSVTRYSGGKTAFIGLLTTALVAVNDAKWAIIIYHDYIQRGFDAIYNDKTPSIAFKKANKQDESLGNINQEFDENVNIPPKCSDPW